MSYNLSVGLPTLMLVPNFPVRPELATAEYSVICGAADVAGMVFGVCPVVATPLK